MREDNVVDLAGQESKLLSRTRYGSHLQMLERMAFRAPDSVQAWTQLTSALVEAGELDRAAITSVALEQATPSWQNLVLRSQALAESDPASALALAQQAAGLEPTEFRTHLQLARCHFAQGDPEGHGLAASRQAVALSEHDPHALQVQAQLLRLHGRTGEAQSVLRRPAADDQIPATRGSMAARAFLPTGPEQKATVYVAVMALLLLAAAANGLAVAVGAINPYSGLPSAVLLALAAVALMVLRDRR